MVRAEKPYRRVMPKLGAGAMSSLAHMDQALTESLQELTFTPFIGGECSKVGRESTAAWKRIASEFDRLLLDPALSEQEEQNYLSALAHAQGVVLRNADRERVSDHPEALHELRLAIVRVGAKASSLFGTSMAERPAPVFDITGYKVRLDPHNRELDEFREALVNACIIAHRVQTMEDAPELFEKNGVYLRMVDITAKLINGWLPPRVRRRLDNRKDEIQHVYKVLEDIGIEDEPSDSISDYTSASGADLYLYQLEWLADLLWYTFRFDAQAYPTATELSSQVSLDINHSDRRFELPTAAQQHHHRPDKVDELRRWFQHYRPGRQEGSAEMTGFYQAIAQLLVTQCNAKTNMWSDVDPIEPVAFSLNFDLELEEALVRHSDIDAFHVVIPVFALTRGRPVERQLRWLLGTVSHEGSPDQDDVTWARAQAAIINPTWEWFPEDSAALPSHIQGPVIVKLHGSPLHHLPPATDPQLRDPFDEYASFEHALTMSESQYLHHIVLLDGLPPFFKSLLGQDRSFFFLGLSVEDWEIKLRLHATVFPDRMPSRQRRGRKMIAINSSFDPHRTMVLAALGIDRWAGSLQELTRQIAD